MFFRSQWECLLLLISAAPSAFGLRDEAEANVKLHTDIHIAASTQNLRMLNEHRSTTREFPDTYLGGGLPIAPLDPELLANFAVFSFGSLTYNGVECSGSPWQATNLPAAALLKLGLTNADADESGRVRCEFAFIHPGSCLSSDAPSGGFVYIDGQTVIGANKVSAPSGASTNLLFGEAPVTVSYETFKSANFPLGRMRPITLPALSEKGACRFSWVHKDEAKQFLPAETNNAFGGFLYELCRADFASTPELRFFLMTGSGNPSSALQLNDLQSHAAEPPTPATLATSAKGQFVRAGNVSMVEPTD